MRDTSDCHLPPCFLIRCHVGLFTDEQPSAGGLHRQEEVMVWTLHIPFGLQMVESGRIEKLVEFFSGHMT